MNLLTLFDWIDQPTCQRVCLTLLHSLWQFAVLAGGAVALERLARGRRVEATYAAQVGLLLVGLAALPATYLLLGEPATTASAESAPAAIEQPAPAASPGVSADIVIVAADVPAAPATPAAEPVAVNAAAEQAEPTVTWQTASQWLLVVYLVGVGLMLARLAASLLHAHRLAARAIPVTAGRHAEYLRRIAERWGMAAAPALATIAAGVTPKVVGLMKPTILLPGAALAGMTCDELELILRHELAHVRRHDMWANLVQRLAEALLFFNPAVWLLSRRISTLREYCCDELACETATEQKAEQLDPRSRYAAALVRVVELSHGAAPAQEVAALAAAAGRPSELRRRVARLFGEPQREPLRLSRGGLLAVGGLVVLLALPLAPSPAASDAEDATEASAFPGPMTEADRVVAAARAKTFGLEGVPKIALTLSYWNSDVLGMQQHPERSLSQLWLARGQQVDADKRAGTTSSNVVAWRDDRLLISNIYRRDDGTPKSEQAKFWSGQEGWIGEHHDGVADFYRYGEVDKLFGGLGSFYFPQFLAAGGQVPWSGPKVDIEQMATGSIDLTRYEQIGSERIDGVECQVFAGPARLEQLWIAKESGLVKAYSRHYAFGTPDNFYSELMAEVAGREFENARDYFEWRRVQPPEKQAELGAQWSKLRWPSSLPGNLTVFSDYQEIAPGVQWPMHCERIVVHTNGRGESATSNYIRAEIETTAVRTDFAMAELAASALPTEGAKVTDRRAATVIEYAWSDDLPEAEIEEKRLAKWKEEHAAELAEEQLENTPINSIDDALGILTEGPAVDPPKVWARAIRYLAEHKEEALPRVIATLDAERRDHPISKLAFALRAMEDPRALPALIRAFPRTLAESRSDYGLILEDADLVRFIQRHDQSGRTGKYIDYGRAIREVTCSLQRLSGQEFSERELNWFSLGDTPTQRNQQRKQLYAVAQQWADWWEAHWQDFTDDQAYAKVNLPPLEQEPPGPLATGLPAGVEVELSEKSSGNVLKSAHEATDRIFRDLDTGREAGWPAELPDRGKIGFDSPELLAWARREGYDLMGVSHTPPGESEPRHCLKPLGLRAWKLTEEQHRRLEEMTRGERPYPLDNPVDLLVPRRKIDPPYDDHSGDWFLFITAEGTAGLIRATAQVTDTNVRHGPTMAGDEFNGVGFHRGVMFSLSTFDQAVAVEAAGGDGAGEAELKKSQLRVLVVDEAGQPIPGATVRQNHVTDIPDGPRDFTIKNHEYQTDADGWATVEWSGNSIDLRLWVSAPGHVMMHAMWSKQFQSDGDQIPGEFTFELPAGTEIGGRVINAAGEPVEGAKITFLDNAISWRFIGTADRKPGVRPLRALDGTFVKTDADGRWSIDFAPSDEDLARDMKMRPGWVLQLRAVTEPLTLKISHPKYAEFDGNQRSMVELSPPLAELRSKEAVVVLQPPNEEAAAIGDQLLAAPPSPTPTEPKKPSPPLAPPQIDAPEFRVVIAKHVVLLNGKEIVTWEELKQRMLAAPQPKTLHPSFYITRGRYEVDENGEAARTAIMLLRKQVGLNGHSQGSLWPRTDVRYDRIENAGDLSPDNPQAIEGTVVDAAGEPVAGAEVLLVTPIDESIGYRTYHMSLVDGRVRNPVNHEMTATGADGSFKLEVEAETPYRLIVVHPAGFRNQQGDYLPEDGKIRLLEWGALVVGLEQSELDEAINLTTTIKAADTLPEIDINQYWSDRRDKTNGPPFEFRHVPPIYSTAIGRTVKGEQGTSYSIGAASVSLIDGDKQSLDLGPLSAKQRAQIESMQEMFRRRGED